MSEAVTEALARLRRAISADQLGRATSAWLLAHDERFAGKSSDECAEIAAKVAGAIIEAHGGYGRLAGAAYGAPVQANP